MIEALQSVRYGVADVDLAEAWYSRLLDVQPYQRTDSALRYCVGGSWLELVQVPELGTSGGVQIQWAVDGLAQELLRLQSVGITPQMPPVLLGDADRPREQAAPTAVLVDPFGTLVGLVEVHDPDAQRARSHRAAEKIALRNVRNALDDLAQEDRQQRTMAARVLALIAVLVVGVLVGAFALHSLRPPTASGEQRLVVPLSGKK